MDLAKKKHCGYSRHSRFWNKGSGTAHVMNKMLIVVAVIVFCAVGIGVWLQKMSSWSDINEKLDQTSHQVQGTSTQTANQEKLETYENKDAGISFQYPDIFERVDIRITNGETGRMFIGVLEFSPNHRISFGGVTKDYTASKGGSLENTYGYEKQGEKYSVKFTWGNQDITPTGFWSVNNGKDMAVVVRNTEIEQVLSRESVAVFVNTLSESFPGVVFQLTPGSSGLVDEKELEVLRQIVSSITFL